MDKPGAFDQFLQSAASILLAGGACYAAFKALYVEVPASDQSAPAAAKTDEGEPLISDGLIACRWCGHDYVNPINWKPTDPEHWWIQFYCPICDRWSETKASNADVERFDKALDQRQRPIHQALTKIEHERELEEMEAEGTRFFRALEAGAYDADDFASDGRNG